MLPDFLGGQNAYEYFAPVAENIKIAPLSSYDQGCVELIQNAFSDYFQGNVDYDRAKANFETAIKERYPDITADPVGGVSLPQADYGMKAGRRAPVRRRSFPRKER